MSEIDLLPRADLPVIWEEFKTKANAVRRIAETLTVTSIEQKEDMAIARRVRLTLREIRIAVEHKRVELGEGHLKEIQKVNGAAKAIREFIEPLEARLLIQETFNERVEAIRIAALSKSRFDEVEAIKPRAVWVPAALAAMPQEEYEGLVARLRDEVKELEAANRLRVEAEKRLAEQAIEMRRQEEAFLDKLQAEKIAENARLATVRADAEAREVEYQATLKVEYDRQQAEQKRLNDEAERVRFEQEKKHRDELSAALAIRTLEREEAEQRRQADLQVEREKTAKLQAENDALEAHLAEAALEVARVAAVEEKRLRDIACAPDVEKLWDFRCRIQGAKLPPVTTREAQAVVEEVSHKFSEIESILKCFCRP